MTPEPEGPRAASRVPPPWAWATVLALGIVLRLVSYGVQARLPLEPDATGVLGLAREFSYSDPWRASYREPGWIATVKTWSELTAYSPSAIRALTTLLGIGLLVAAALFFRRHLAPVPAFLCTALVSLHGLLVLSAGRGLREELVAILVLVAVSSALDATRGLRPLLSTTAAVAALAVIRWEIALLALALLLAAAAVRRLPLRFVAAPLAAVLLAAGPWLVQNEREYGDPLAHSNSAATFWYRADRFGPAGVSPGSAGFAPEADVQMTWATYYLEVLGPVEAVERVTVGTAGLLHELVATAAWPLSERWVSNRTDSSAARRLAAVADAVSSVLAWLVVAAVALGLVRRGSRDGLATVSLLVVLAGCASYGALWRLPFFEPRFVEFAVPLSGVLVVKGLSSLSGLRTGSAELARTSSSG